MGLIERMKESAKHAEAGVEAHLAGPTTEHRERAMRLNETGVNHPATVRGMTETGRSDPGGGKETEFAVEVDPDDSPYQASFAQYVLASEIAGIEPDTRITVRVDPADRSTMMFWGLG